MSFQVELSDITLGSRQRAAKVVKKKCIVANCRNYETGHHSLCNKHAGSQKLEKECCAICMEDENECKQPLSCGHWIHFDCVLKTCKKECPMCKSVLKFSAEQTVVFNAHKKEIKMKFQREESLRQAEISFRERDIRREQREESLIIGRRQYRYQQQATNTTTHFMSNDLIVFINTMSEGRNERIDRMELIQILLEML